MRGPTHRIPGYVLTDHEFSVPLEHARPDGERITVFAREVVAAGKEEEDIPCLLFLQGGPGSASPRPLATDPRWLRRATQDYRVLLLDQRGTGLSSRVNHQTLARFPSPEAQAEYLRSFRADSIVGDAELIRGELIGDRPWSILGQSYGGFCAVTYLSLAPEGLREVLVTGGLPPLDRTADDVYRATYARVADRNRRYYERYPDDADRVRLILDHLGRHDVRLPTGDRLSPRRFLQRGMDFGGSTGFETVHYLVEQAFVAGVNGAELSYPFLRELEHAAPFEANPIYALLHEAIYCQGEASRWAAERVRAEVEWPETFFSGEMIYPWMFEEYGRLRPLAAAAELLAELADWPALYDVDVLQRKIVPVAAAVYADDMYVERAFSLETADAIGARVWLTNEYEHDALRVDGEAVLDRLLRMLHGEL